MKAFIITLTTFFFIGCADSIGDIIYNNIAVSFILISLTIFLWKSKAKSRN